MEHDTPCAETTTGSPAIRVETISDYTRKKQKEKERERKRKSEEEEERAGTHRVYIEKT